MRRHNSPPPSQRESTHLEPRVAKLEVGLDRLTQDVGDLVSVVRTQGSQMEAEIQKLVVAVTQASGPRKTDWSVIISSVLLIMAIGSAVFWPLQQTSQESKQAITSLTQEMSAHKSLDNHPVGAALIQRLEEQIALHVANNEKENKNIIEITSAELSRSEAKSSEKVADALAARQLQLDGIISKQEVFNEKLFARVLSLEQINRERTDKDLEELRQWRVNAMVGKLKVPSDQAPR